MIFFYVVHHETDHTVCYLTYLDISVFTYWGANASAIFQIERHTYGLLQCHPHPNEFVDTSRTGHHCAFFMGLQRKQGTPQQEGQQFDIRVTVDEFRHSVNMYMNWKPGMDLYVTHVRRRQIPAYVFPNCIRPARPPRPAGLASRPGSGPGPRIQSAQLQKTGSNTSAGEDDLDDRMSEAHEGETLRLAKRRQENLVDEVKPLKRGSVRADNGSSAERPRPVHLEPDQCLAPVTSGIMQIASAEEAAFQAITSGPEHGVYGQADDELDVVEEGFGVINGVGGFAKAVVASEPLDLELEEIGRGDSTGAVSLSIPQASSLQNGNLDELEVQSIIPWLSISTMLHPLSVSPGNEALVVVGFLIVQRQVLQV